MEIFGISEPLKQYIFNADTLVFNILNFNVIKLQS